MSNGSDKRNDGTAPSPTSGDLSIAQAFNVILRCADPRRLQTLLNKAKAEANANASGNGAKSS